MKRKYLAIIVCGILAVTIITAAVPTTTPPPHQLILVLRDLCDALKAIEGSNQNKEPFFANMELGPDESRDIVIVPEGMKFVLLKVFSEVYRIEFLLDGKRYIDWRVCGQQVMDFPDGIMILNSGETLTAFNPELPSPYKHHASVWGYFCDAEH